MNAQELLEYVKTHTGEEGYGKSSWDDNYDMGVAAVVAGVKPACVISLGESRYKTVRELLSMRPDLVQTVVEKLDCGNTTADGSRCDCLDSLAFGLPDNVAELVEAYRDRAKIYEEYGSAASMYEVMSKEMVELAVSVDRRIGHALGHPSEKVEEKIALSLAQCEKPRHLVAYVVAVPSGDYLYPGGATGPFSLACVVKDRSEALAMASEVGGKVGFVNAWVDFNGPRWSPSHDW